MQGREGEGTEVFGLFMWRKAQQRRFMCGQSRRPAEGTGSLQVGEPGDKHVQQVCLLRAALTLPGNAVFALNRFVPSDTLGLNTQHMTCFGVLYVQGFLLLHSLGGGTGSGLGTYLLGLMEVRMQAGMYVFLFFLSSLEPASHRHPPMPEPFFEQLLLADLDPLTECVLLCIICYISSQEEFPDVFRFSCPVIPSEDDHVVTSPYNATLAASVLVNSAHCVLPLENSALAAISTRLEIAAGGRGAAGGKRAAPSGAAAASSGSSASATANLGGMGQSAGPGGGGGKGGAGGKQGGWDVMNGLAANLLLHLTSSIRFEGSLNTDLNDITMNLVSGFVGGTTCMFPDCAAFVVKSAFAVPSN